MGGRAVGCLSLARTGILLGNLFGNLFSNLFGLDALQGRTRLIGLFSLACIERVEFETEREIARRVGAAGRSGWMMPHDEHVA
jgi:hypothetical protein